LAHQWFGDSVTLGEWQDVWLNEGFATYASWLWFEHDLGAEGLEMWVEDALEALAAEESTPPGDPGVEELFGTSVYERGGLTLHALRLTVGDRLFFDILREWVSRYTYGNATTEDFISLVQEKAGHLSGVDLEAFFDAWLVGETVPELPEAATTG
jgi:aminopeptidase N